MKALFALGLLTITAMAPACLWDYDTVAAEASELPIVVRAVSGRFPRNPPIYYEARLRRVVQELREDPTKLDLYDDAGVACDRLHRDDEALRWMAAKRRKLEALGKAAPKEGWYRYHANIGTFRIHRWLGNGAKKAELSEAKSARADIADAIRIKPDAHFGRERVQLRVMDWLIRLKQGKDERLEDYLASLDESPKDARKSIEGLAGLVVMGNAWESVDAFAALGSLLRENESAILGYMAHMRADELIRSGKKMLGKRNLDPKESFADSYDSWAPSDERLPGVKKGYHDLRRNADAWHASRTRYIEAEVKKGRHPDTHQDFWSGFQEVPMLNLEQYSTGGSPYDPPAGIVVNWPLLGGLGAVGLGVAAWAIRRRRLKSR